MIKNTTGVLRQLILTFLLSIIFISAHSQILTPVKWSYDKKKISDNEYLLIFKATIDNTWHLYSQVTPPSDGPLPTVFTFEKNVAFSLVGKTTEPNTKPHYDPVFEQNIKSFDKEAVFTQKVKVLSNKPFKIKGLVEFQACDDTKCTSSDDEFTFSLEGSALASADNTVQTPAPVATEIATPKKDSIKPVVKVDAKPSQASPYEQVNKSLWMLFFVSFWFGLLAIFTPCVFPMIPMTVSFFMKDKAKGKAILEAFVFSISIILIYTVIGTIVALTLGANFASFLSTHWIPNVLFFLIFVFFAASFFGMFEITLPSWIINKSDAKADKGGFLGAFFMAFTLVLVSFSCTGPIVGAILVASAGGKVLEPIVGMLGFSLAFALPFGLFAFFPHLLKSLPKSGGWLNSVKVVLGFLELALGLKFLSIADQTYNWRILDREIYLAFWIVIFFLMGLYLLGKLKFAHDSDVKYISVPRLMLAIITFTFVAYMIPGMWGAPLKSLSGYLPPTTTQDFDVNAIVRDNPGSGQGVAVSSICDPPKYAEFLPRMEHGLEGYYNYEQGLVCAKKQNKPVFIDFTGLGCVNCREMEANVWSDPKVLKRLREDYIIIALYVDSKTELPENEWITSKIDGKVKKSIGKKYADLQISRYNVNSQPYYVLLDDNGELLVQPRAYDLDVDAFVKFLDAGKDEFKKREILGAKP